MLITPGRAEGMPFRLKANEGKSFIGSYVLGMGFVMMPAEAQVLIAKDPRNRDVLFPYLIGDDLNSRPDQSPSRWVINFKDWPLERSAKGSWKDPADDPVKGLLARWFDNNRGPAELAWIAAVLDLVNERLEAMPDVGRHLQVGPSHFMNKDLTQASIERIWKYSILPYLEEQFFGREGALADFDLKALHEQAIQRASGQS